jgi:hypothetical protein
VGAGLTSLALLGTVLVAKGWTDDGGVPTTGATWGAVSNNTVRPSPSDVSQEAGSPSAASVGNPVQVGHGRLRNADLGLCLDTHDGRLGDGAQVVLARCSTAGSQQWTYEDDGLLRSTVDPGLCLDSDAERRTVVVADCLAHAEGAHYDLTVRGELLLRRGKGLLVAPGKGETVTVTGRDGTKEQRWYLESADESAPTQQGTQSPRTENTEHPENREHPENTETSSPSGGTDGAPLAPAPPPGADQSPGGSSDPQGSPSGQYRTRVAQVDHDDSDPAAPVEVAGSAVTAVVDTVTSLAAPVTAPLRTLLP